MAEPTFWRTEIWHPLTVHFPLCLLLIATLVKLITLWLNGEQKHFWQKVGSYALYAGCLAAWASIYTGDMAEGIVSRKLCDPTILKSHETAAFNLGYFFTGAAALNLALSLNLIRVYQKVMHVLIVLLMLVGAYYLIYAGHLGAQVVYQQAGGVNVPSANCAEF
jgi:uncharacterized membrane protein